MIGRLTCGILVLAIIVPGSICQAADYFDDADKALLERRYDSAVSNYLRALNRVSKRDARLIWDDLGYCFLKKAEYGKALDYLEMYSSAFPEDYDVLFYMAIAHFGRGGKGEAGKILDRIASDIHFDGIGVEAAAGRTLWNEMGDRVGSESAGRLRKERGIYLLEKTPDTAVIHIDAFNENNEGLFHGMRGILLEANGSDREARAEFAKAEKLGFLTGDEGVEKLDHRLKDHPGGPAWIAHEKSLAELQKGEIGAAIGTLKMALRADQKSYEINHNLALLAMDVDDLDMAETYCARALWFRETSVQDHELMGNIGFKKKEFLRALSEFQRAVELDDENPGAYYNVGSAHYALKDTDLAEKYWIMALDCEKNGKPVPAGIPDAPARAGRITHAVTVSTKPISHLAGLSLGRLYLEREFSDRAMEYLKAAIEAAPKDPDAYLDMAKALLAKGRKDEAADHIKKYLALGGRDESGAKLYLKKAGRIP